MNVPNVYSHNGSLFCELPDGSLSTEDPFAHNGMEFLTARMEYHRGCEEVDLLHLKKYLA